jgi:hypothetical protein
MVGGLVVEVGELGVAVGVLTALGGLGVSLQAVAPLAQQPAGHDIADHVAPLPQRPGQRADRFGGPPQRRHRIAPGHGIESTTRTPQSGARRDPRRVYGRHRVDGTDPDPARPRRQLLCDPGEPCPPRPRTPRRLSRPHPDPTRQPPLPATTAAETPTNAVAAPRTAEQPSQPNPPYYKSSAQNRRKRHYFIAGPYVESGCQLRLSRCGTTTD